MDRSIGLRFGDAIVVAFAVLLIGTAGASPQSKLAVSPLFTPVLPVANPCSRFAAGSAVQTPPALASSGGVLRVDFSYQTTYDSDNRQLFCFMTPSGLENPTLQVNPGDRLILKITNNTPAGTNPMVLDPPNCGVNTMNSSSVNIHFHGVNVLPICGWDEVIKTIINPGQTFQYNFVFPKNEPPGLYWYHPHVHGLVDPTLLGGASGAIVVGGIDNVQPAVAGLPQQVLVIRDQPQVQGLPEAGAGCTNGVPFEDITVNNVPINSYQAVPGGPVTFTPAVLNVNASETQFWRASNSSANTILDLQVQYDGVAQTMQLVSVDGVAMNSQDGSQQGTLVPVTHFRLPPGSRVEFIITTPSSSVSLAQLVTSSINTGADGDCDPNRPILNIALGGDGQQDKLAHRRSKADGLSLSTGQRFRSLGSARVAAYRQLFFDENLAASQYFMAVEGQPETVYNPNESPAITSTQGTVEEWTVANHTLENHEFHIHQVHFLVESQNNFESNGQTQAPAVTGQYLDTVEVPGWDGNPDDPYPNVILRIDFRGQDTGSFVFHCHIASHEDQGMMNIIQIVSAGVKSAATAKAAVRIPAK
jgi:FtsP/CotA-like multicopper oxidase with cupredoxin domain